MVGPAFRVAPADARVLYGAVEGAAGVMEDLAHLDAVSDQLLSGGVEVVHGEEAVRRARLGRRDSLAEDDRRFRVVRRHLHGVEAVARDVGVEPPAEILVERLRAIDVRNAEHHDFELHVSRFNFFDFCLCHNSSYEFPAITRNAVISLLYVRFALLCLNTQMT